MLLTVSHRATQTNASPACETNMGGSSEVIWALLMSFHGPSMGIFMVEPNWAGRGVEVCSGVFPIGAIFVGLICFVRL